MNTCPCCHVGTVAFLYDICPECGWEFHGERVGIKTEVVHSHRFVGVTIEQWRATRNMRSTKAA